MIAFAIMLASAPASVETVVVQSVQEQSAKELQPRLVRASSFLKNGWNAAEENYLPPYVADDNAKTAWVEGAAGNGEGEWLEWVGPRLEKAKRYVVYIKNGYQKSPQLYKANSRAARLAVELVVDGKPLGDAPPLEVKLRDALGWQRFEVPIAAAPRAVAGVRFVVKEVVAGKRYTDTCISDVRVFVDADDRYNGAAEALAQEQVRRFAAERALAAKQLNAKGNKARALPTLAKADAGAAAVDAPALPKLGAPPSSMTTTVEGWRRVAAQLPPGAQAAAYALADGLVGDPIALLYPFIRRDAVTYFDTPDPVPPLEKKLAATRAKENAEKAKFVERCEQERSAERKSLGDKYEEHPCDCELRFYGCGSELGEATRVERDIEGARISGVFIPVGEPLLNPSKVLVTHAEYLGDRQPTLTRATCLIDYASSDVVAQCDRTHWSDDATVEVFRVKLDAKNNVAAIYGGEPGKKADKIWLPALDVVASGAREP